MQLLKDENIFPDDNVLKQELGKNYEIYNEFFQTIKNENFNLVPEWRYYNDGKSWLCKVTFKKKTIIWFSIWENFFKLTFYFSEKTYSGIFNLEIDKKIKDNFVKSKKIGKLIPLTIDINLNAKDLENKNLINDIFKIIEYKKKF